MKQTLSNSRGQRLYLTRTERMRFLRVIETYPGHTRSFCKMITLTGCRISEALAFERMRIDPDACLVVFESLKKRKRGVFRSVPVPTAFITELQEIVPDEHGRLWPWCRTTGYSLIKRAMHEAKIVGPQASPKGLRHGFAINALEAQVPLTLIQKWMGHSSIEITAIYLQAGGEEEYRMAKRMWREDRRR